MSIKRTMRRLLCVLAVWVAGGISGFCAAPAEDLFKGFSAPPEDARPWVLWFWQNGNITREGITADLEAMKRAGIGGVLWMEVAHGAPEGPVKCLSPEWYGMVKFALSEADRLGIKVNMNNDIGWSGSGGPWITPEMAMKKLTISETQVTGGKTVSEALPVPETGGKGAHAGFYRDITVLAFPAIKADTVKMSDYSPKVSASVSGDNVKLQDVCDGSLKTTLTLPKADPESPQWVQLEFQKPFTARTLKMTLTHGPPRFMNDGFVEVSDDGVSFNKVCDFSTSPPDVVITLPETAAKVFRIVFNKSRHPRMDKVRIAELELSPSRRLENLAAKALVISPQFTPERNVELRADWPELASELVIPKDRILDISSKMDAKGKLVWEAPAGDWTVLRIGYTLTGRENHPAPEEGVGLESDKLSKEATQLAFSGLIAKVLADNPSLSGSNKTFQATHVDSWEAASQNWTDKMPEEFRQRRGYDLIKYLPVITGRVVDSQEMSERFLWDLRETVSELLRSNYAAELRRLANENGLKLSIEAYFGPPTDEIAYGGMADEPTAEFWRPNGVHYSALAMSSAAHVYGRKIVPAESFTAGDKERWLDHPGTLKEEGDWAFCHGINRFVFHRYAMQPWTNREPGMGMGPWGIHYERTQTWWEQSKAWHEYLARCQYLLQKGLFAADVCVVQPEGTYRFNPPAYLWATASESSYTAPPVGASRPGYSFDACPAEVLLTRMSVKDGRLVLPDGMSYSVLLLPDVEAMTPQLLRKVKEFADAGATVVGLKRPVKSPGLNNYPQCDEEVKKLAEELWGSGKVISDKIPAEVLSAKGIPQDFTARNDAGVNNLRFIHRTIGGTEFYFVCNKTDKEETALCEFRIQGRRPQLWHPETGAKEQVAVYNESKGVTQIPVHFGPNESVFVVFSPDKAVEPDRIVAVGHDGKTVISAGEVARGDDGSAAGNFTMTVWVKPSAEIGLPEESDRGYTRAAQNYAIYAAPGHEAFGDRKHTGAGISAGINGVTVLEHGAGTMAPVLVYSNAIKDWTHLAVVYRDGVPNLYVNGKFAKQGRKGMNTAHPSVEAKHSRKYDPFKGESTGARQYASVLDESALASLVQEGPLQAGPAAPPEISVIRNQQNKVVVKANQGGVYTLKSADGKVSQITVAVPSAPQPVAGPWTVSFDPKRGGPEKPVVFRTLEDWAKHADPAVRNYSGTAVYRTSFKMDAPEKNRFAKPKTVLDLGKVAVSAEVVLNGRSLGILWKEPYRMDISGALKEGENRLEVNVVNLWVNRLIADEELPEDTERKTGNMGSGELASWPQWLLDGKASPEGRRSFTTWKLWKKGEERVESGLIGPVTLQTMEGGKPSVSVQ